MPTALNQPPHMPARAMRMFVWDLADEGIEEVAARLREAGVDGVNLALAYHGGRFYCPHNPRRALVHAPDGALYFQPLVSCYEGIKPRVHPEYGSGAFVARVREVLREYGIHLAAWVALFNNMSLSLAHTECTCVNALGDKLEGALCPSNPAVRAYGQALIEDLAHRVGVDSIELEDFAFTAHDAYVGASWQGIAIGASLGYLLSLCFCEHCRRRAEESNLEVEDLARRVERMIRAGLSGDLSDRRIGDEIADPYHPLSRYAATRAETITSLLDEMIEAADGSPVVLQPVLCEEPDDAWRWGVELHTLRERMLRATLRTCCSVNGTDVFVRRYMELLRLGRHVAADVRLSDPRRTEADFATAIEHCLAAGVDRFIFSHYGLIRLEMLEWIGALART
jgi:hypothetical protein